MTAICTGGGTSSSRPGFGETVVASAATFANMFLNSPSPWAAAMAGAMAATAYDLTTFCASDPPGLVVPTALEWAQFLGTSTPLVVGPVASVITNFFAYYAWFAFCKCDAGTPPSATAATEPSGTPQLAPPVPSPLAGPCASGTIAFSQTNGQVPPSATAQDQTKATVAIAGLNVSWIRATITLTGTLGAGDDFVQLQVRNVSNAIIQQVNHSILATDASPYVLEAAVPPDAWTATLEGLTQGVTGPTIALSAHVEFWCNGTTPTTAVTPCCPPDPLLVSMLSQIQQMVTLIQRQASPFAYVYGANHTGLSGHGSFAASGLLGVSVAPTTIPTSYGLEVGSPDEHFGLGFITLGTTDGWTTSRPLDHDGTLMIPPSAGVFTLVGYTLSAGVVADIRELVREP